MKTITGIRQIDQLIAQIDSSVQTILADTLLGFYLFGSLTYDDFKSGRSDIDLFAIVSKPTTKHENQSLKQMHQQVEAEFPQWAKRIEAQYVPIGFFEHILPPETPRPYFGQGMFYPKASYGNEWLINNYLLQEHGITLVGTDFNKLVDPIPIADVKQACVQDFRKEWLPKINTPDYLADPHQQSYLVLNLCRILYTIQQSQAVSKSTAASWVVNQYPQWQELITAADNWSYGDPLKSQAEVVQFITFISKQIE